MKSRKFLISGFAISLFLAGVVSFYASSHPDGLEKVAGDIGFLDSAKKHSVEDGPLSGYSLKGVDNDRISGGLAGVIGVIATGAVGAGVFYLIARKKAK